MLQWLSKRRRQMMRLRGSRHTHVRRRTCATRTLQSEIETPDTILIARVLIAHIDTILIVSINTIIMDMALVQ